MCDCNEVDIKRREFIGTQRIYKDSTANLKSAGIYVEREADDCSYYVTCDPAPIAFSCIITIPPGFELDTEEEGGNNTIIQDCTSISKSVIYNPDSKITVPVDCNCSSCTLPYPVKIRQIKVKGGVQIRLYTFITGRPLGPDGKPSVYHTYDDTTVVSGEAAVCVDSTIAYATLNCMPDIDYGLVAYFQNAEVISSYSEEKIARLNGNLYVYVLPQST